MAVTLKVDKELRERLNRELSDDIAFFFRKLNDRSKYKHGYTDSYDDEGEPALGLDVDYFHPQETQDDLMLNIMRNIVLNPLVSPESRVCNTIVSHFYGGRGIHQTMLCQPDPTKAVVDFERLSSDDEYRDAIDHNLKLGYNLGLPIYSKTELRTSLFGSANKFALETTGVKSAEKINLLMWIASFIPNGVANRILTSESLEDVYKALTSLPGVGQYYGYNSGVANTLNPAINASHDEPFCVPGPGCRKTLDMMFGKGCKVKYGERVVWFRHNYEDFIGKFDLHPSSYNVEVDGVPIFSEPQDTLKVHGCEVALCQYGVFDRLRSEPKLAKRRVVPRLDDFPMEEFYNSGVPV